MEEEEIDKAELSPDKRPVLYRLFYCYVINYSYKNQTAKEEPRVRRNGSLICATKLGS
jgi:hypothetical protein